MKWICEFNRQKKPIKKKHDLAADPHERVSVDYRGGPGCMTLSSPTGETPHGSQGKVSLS